LGKAGAFMSSPKFRDELIRWGLPLFRKSQKKGWGGVVGARVVPFLGKNSEKVRDDLPLSLNPKKKKRRTIQWERLGINFWILQGGHKKGEGRGPKMGRINLGNRHSKCSHRVAKGPKRHCERSLSNAVLKDGSQSQRHRRITFG